LLWDTFYIVGKQIDEHFPTQVQSCESV